MESLLAPQQCSRRLFAGLAALALAAGLAPQLRASEDPLVWITLGERQAAALHSSAVGDDWQDHLTVHETHDGIVLAQVPESRLGDLAGAVHNRLRRCGGFVAHPSREAALEALYAPAELLAPAPLAYTIDNGPVVRALLAEIKAANIVATINQLSSYHTRYYKHATGVQAAHWLRDTWLSMAAGRGDVSVALFPHPNWDQPSVIMTITGTTFPDEVVVIGGHLDSINRSGGAAPGADDDASGVSSFTETARAALARGYRPARTVKFMAYAAEEVGLRGSQEIAQAFKRDGVNVVGVLQLDMTAFQGTATLDTALITDRTHAEQNQFLEQIIDTYLQLRRGTTQCGYGCSDHASWSAAGFRASMPSEATFADINRRLHTTNDTLAAIGGHADHAVKFSRIAAAFLGELAKGTLAGGGGDTTPPSVSITAPADGATVAGSVVVTANAGDDVAVARVELSADGVLVGTDTVPPYEFSWDTAGLAEGAHGLAVTAYDGAGNSESSTVQVIVNNGGTDQTASFDAALQAPRCALVGRSCDSGTLLTGRGSLGPEPNAPNTVADGCADGDAGRFHVADSNDRITVASVDGSDLAAGRSVRVEAAIWADANFNGDRVDVFQAANAASPSWQLVATLRPARAGAQTLSTTFTLPAGTPQVVRARYRSGGSATPCGTGNFRDHDDLVFAVR